MIEYTPAARRQVQDLAAHYQMKERFEAVENLGAALRQAESLIARTGRAWLHIGIYWIAFERSDPPTIVGVFWDRADIGRRYSSAS